MDGQRLVVFWVSLACFVAGLLDGTPATALDPTRSVAQMFHRAYTRDDGLPGIVNAITQSPDGYLWIGVNSGLYRFDGVRFERIAEDRLLSRDISALTTTTSGDLWLGYADGGFSRIRDGVVVNYPRGAGSGETTVKRIVEAPNGGGLWAMGALVPLRFDGQRWQEIPGPWVALARMGGVWSMEAGRDGTLWAKNGDGVFYCRPRCARFVVARGYAGGVMGFAQARDGRVWTSDKRAPGQMYAMPDLAGVSDAGIPSPVRGGQISQNIHGKIFLDRDGTLWNINVQHGLLRARSILEGHADPNLVDAFGASDGLSSDVIVTFFEDSESNIWVATNQGLDRFRPANVVLERKIPVTASVWGYNGARVNDTLFFFVNTSDDNSTPFAGRRGQLYRVNGDGAVQMVLPDTEMPESMMPAADGGLWMGTSQGLLKLQNGALREEPIPAGILEDLAVRYVAETAAGDLWVSASRHGLWRRKNGVWSKVEWMPSPMSPLEMELDAKNALWARGIATVRRYATEPALESTLTVSPNIGDIRTMHADKRGMLFGGEFGLARYDGRGLRTLRTERVPALAFTSGIVESDGQTWVASQAGILRFDTRALEHAMVRPDAPAPAYELFDRRDGVTGWIQQDTISTRSAFLGPDGRIWFLTDRGVVWIDPHNIHHNDKPPPVAIRALTVDGRTYSSPHDLKLPAGASNLEIDYAALSFVEPSRVRFRYRLDGVDNDWVDPGERRQVFYTQLGPGSYNFHIMAANDAGVWNRVGAALNFTIAPTFVQSIWFKLIIGLALTGLAWLAYSQRLRQETARLQGRFDVRIAERERIARELHDTLLQGCQGLLLRFQSIANRVPPGDALHKDIEEALDRADVVLAEGRARVRDLRTSSGASDLAQSLLEAASSIIGGDVPRFELTVEGEQRSLNALVGEEMLRVFEEAVRNVLKHANATKIDAVLAFGRQTLRLSIRDDGAGIAQSRANERTTGQFGLVGMRERAERIGGQLQVASREGAGTEVVMVAPAHAAYKRPRLWPFQRHSTSLSEEAA